MFRAPRPRWPTGPARLLLLGACAGLAAGLPAGAAAPLPQPQQRPLVSARLKADNVLAVLYLRNCVTALEAQRAATTSQKFDFVPARATCAGPFLKVISTTQPASVKNSSIMIDPDQENYVVNVMTTAGRRYRFDSHKAKAEELR